MFQLNIPDGMPTLSRGGHTPESGKACIMEIVAILSNDDWTDHPDTVHPFLRAMAIKVNDDIPDIYRHRLNPLIGWFFGTNDPGLDEVLLTYLDIKNFDEDEDDTHEIINDAWFKRHPGLFYDHNTPYPEDALVEAYADKLIEWLVGALDVADQYLRDHEPRILTKADVETIHRVGVS